MTPLIRLALATLILGATLPAAERGLRASLLPLLVDEGRSAPRGMWLSAYGGSSVSAETDDASGRRGVRIELGQAHQRMIWNLNQHQQPRPQELRFDATARLALRLRADADQAFSGRLLWGWTRDHGQLHPAVGAAVELPAGEAIDVYLPLPAAPETKPIGWYLGADTPITVTLEGAEIVSFRDVLLDPIEDRRRLLDHDRVTITGRAAPGVAEVRIDAAAAEIDGGAPGDSWTVPARDGRFSLELTRGDLAASRSNLLRATAIGRDGPAASSTPVAVFAFPAVVGAELPRLRCVDGKLLRDGEPFAFVGLNYTPFQMGFCRSADWESLFRHARQLEEWGIGLIRLTLNMSMFQVEEGVFPDDQRWGEIVAAHHCNVEFMTMLEIFIDRLAEAGIYVVIDWHETPTNPYRYFVGGDPTDTDRSRPGTAIAWLADDQTKRTSWDMSDPRKLEALLSTHRWMARWGASRSNVVGHEVPYNEPHAEWESNQANWTRITALCADAVKDAAPELLTFTQNPNYAHNTEAWAFTWLNPYGIDGQGPHHYIANGPIRLRPDAKDAPMPWLARDVDETFALSLPSLFFPSYVWRQPIYNGEGGEHGAATFLPDLPLAEAEDHMYEASLAQCYAAGVVGHVNWTMLMANTNQTIFAAHGPRYARVMAAGPVDWSRAEVAVIQNTEATKSHNGHNFSCVPFVEHMLTLHLGPVHYLSDDYLIFNGLSRRSLGLEQSADNAIDFSAYRAVVVDRRNLDRRVSELVERLALPVLWVDDMAKLDADELATFLTEAGVHVDRRSPAGTQIAIGPGHVVLYQRRGPGGEATVYPRVERAGSFALIDETSVTRFTGTSSELQERGVAIELAKWRSLILTIKDAD